MRQPVVRHYHYDKTGHVRKHLHWGGRVFHEHENLTGYGQFVHTLHENDKQQEKRRHTYFGRSSAARLDPETAMNPKKGLNRREYKELVGLIQACDVHDCFNTRDIARRTQLEGKATEEQLKRAWKSAGLSSEEFEETFVNPKKDYKLVATFVSKSAPHKRMYEVKKDTSGELSCNCPAWIFKKSGVRTCKHVQAVSTALARNPDAKYHRYAARSLYNEAKREQHKGRRTVLQIRAAQELEDAVRSEVEETTNPKGNPGSLFHYERASMFAGDAMVTKGKNEKQRLLSLAHENQFLGGLSKKQGIANPKGKYMLVSMKNPNKKWHINRYYQLRDVQDKHPDDRELEGQILEEAIASGLINRNPNLKLAKEMRKRYQGDVKAGHSDAAEYWRGQAAAYFTGNPTPKEGDHVSFKKYIGYGKWVTDNGTLIEIIRSKGDIIGYKIKYKNGNVRQLSPFTKITTKNPQITVFCAACNKPIISMKTARLVGNKLYHSECLKFIKKVQGVR